MSEVRTLKMGIHWEGMADFYTAVLRDCLVLSKDADKDEWLRTALDCIAYARFIEAGYAKCDCGCEDD